MLLDCEIRPRRIREVGRNVGRICIGEVNVRVFKQSVFARSYQLTNTIQPHNLTQTTTWRSHNGQVHSQIDFILVRERFKSSVNKAKKRTIPGADIGNEYGLVMMTFKLKLP